MLNHSQDLWNIGHFLGIDSLNGPLRVKGYIKMTSDLNRAQALDWKGNTGQWMKEVLTGIAKATNEREGQMILHYMELLHKKFMGFVIR